MGNSLSKCFKLKIIQLKVLYLNKYVVHLYDNEYMNVTPFVSAHTQAVMLRSSRDPGTLNPKLTSAMLRDHYVREIKLMKVGSVNRAH